MAGKALEAAVSYRNTVYASNPPLLKREYVSILRKNNTSGCPGVCKYRTGYWVAFWPTETGQKKTVKFSIRRYGEEKAHDLAIRARKRAVEELTEPHEPSKKKRTAKHKKDRFRPHPISASSASMLDTIGFRLNFTMRGSSPHPSLPGFRSSGRLPKRFGKIGNLISRDNAGVAETGNTGESHRSSADGLK